MKILKRTGIVILAVILLLVIISFFLPGKIRVERSVEINAPPAVPFSLINNLKKWSDWSPWHQKDPNAKWTFGELTEGEGAWYSWESENRQVGKGKLTITESKADELIKVEIDFVDQGKGTGDYTFQPTGSGGVKVTWGMNSDMGMNPIGKWMGLFMDKMLGPDFEKGLQNLKQASENMPPVKETIGGYDFELRDMASFIVAGIREKVEIRNLEGSKFAGWYAAIGKALGKVKIDPTGQPMAIYYSFENGVSDMEAAVPVSALAKDAGQVKFHELPATKALVVRYYGDYSKTEPVYSQAFSYMEKQGMKSNGAPMEIFITDPGMESDTSKWLTEIAFPIQ